MRVRIEYSNSAVANRGADPFMGSVSKYEATLIGIYHSYTRSRDL